MKPYVLVLVGALAGSGAPPHPEVPHELTQLGMNEAAGRELAAAEGEMVRALDALREKANGYPDSIAKLERAQSAWEDYREAQLDAEWPSDPREYGSVHSMCIAGRRTKLTEARTAELRAMLRHEEGEVCNSLWPK